MASNGYAAYLFDQTYLQYCIKAVRHEGQKHSPVLMVKRFTLLLQRIDEFLRYKTDSSFETTQLKHVAGGAADKFENFPWYEPQIWLKFHKTLKYLLAILKQNASKDRNFLAAQLKQASVLLKQVATISEGNRKNDKSMDEPVRANDDYVEHEITGRKSSGILNVQSLADR